MEMIDYIMISIGRKLFEEIDTPTGSKVVDEGKINRIIKRESSWVGDIKGIDSFPCGNVRFRSIFHTRKWCNDLTLAGRLYS